MERERMLLLRGEVSFYCYFC